ncbi:MAG: CCA tRNA nucleotidyltransferase [Oscillospiraceae bacterium]
MELKMPVLAQEIIDKIRANNGTAYLVGGAVRDMMLLIEPSDLDIACSLSQDELLQLFENSKNIGGIYGTVSVNDVEITPYRCDGEYKDCRHPADLSFGCTIEADLSRRDFTVNAMAYDGQELIDPFGGERDIKNRVLRCVGSADAKFAEDALRILRLFRFAAVTGFNVEWDTFDAAIRAAANISALPKERVRNEMQMIMMSNNPHVIAPLITAGGLISYGFACDAPCLHSLASVQATMLARWWALIFFCRADINLVCTSFNFSAAFMRDLHNLTVLYNMKTPIDVLQLKLALVNMPNMDFAEAFAALATINPRFVQIDKIFRELCQSNEPFTIKDLAIGGNDLLQIGVKPKKIGDILRELQILVIKNHSLNNYDYLIKIANNLKYLL